MTNLLGKWATGWVAVRNPDTKTDEDRDFITGEIVAFHDGKFYIMREGKIYARHYSCITVLERKPDEAGPYR